MALDFRLSYNSGYDYTDLLPYTNLEAIDEVGRVLKYSTLELEIPASSELEQTISAALTEKQKIAPFTVDLLDTGLQELRDYCTIDQIESTETGFTVTRLGKLPKASIHVQVIFWEAGL